MYCARTARQATPQECHETIARTTDSALYGTCRACVHGQRLMGTVSWANTDGADTSPIYNDTEETIMTMTIRDAIEAHEADTSNNDSIATAPAKTTKPANFDPATRPKKAAKTATATAAAPATAQHRKPRHKHPHWKPGLKRPHRQRQRPTPSSTYANGRSFPTAQSTVLSAISNEANPPPRQASKR